MEMIDVESEIFTLVSNAVKAEYPEAYVTGEYVQSPSSFPCVSFIEIDNATYQNSQTQSTIENHVVVTYEVNIYSNKTSGRKSECKKIASIIDNLIMSLNFTRIMLQPVTNQNDATIYRMLGRYRAVISKEKQFFRR
jgi:hypothetical protein